LAYYKTQEYEHAVFTVMYLQLIFHLIPCSLQMMKVCLVQNYHVPCLVDLSGIVIPLVPILEIQV